MSKKYVCPICGGELLCISHRLMSYSRPISAVTGKLNKKKKITAATWETDYYSGIECNCGFKYNITSGEITGGANVNPSIIEELCEKINHFNNDDIENEMF